MSNMPIAAQPALFTNAVRLARRHEPRAQAQGPRDPAEPASGDAEGLLRGNRSIACRARGRARGALPEGASCDPEGYDAERLELCRRRHRRQLRHGGAGGSQGRIPRPIRHDQISAGRDPRFLVVNERFDPYWRAYVDGKAARIYPTNVVMRGVVVPPGAREVSMIYRPYDTSGRAWAFYLAGLALFGLGCWGIGRVDRRFPTLTRGGDGAAAAARRELAPDAVKCMDR